MTSRTALRALVASHVMHESETHLPELPPQAVRGLAEEDWQGACEVYVTAVRGAGRAADGAARGLIALRANAEPSTAAATLAVAVGVVRIACAEAWCMPAAYDLPALGLAAAALEAEARGGQMGEPLRLAVWLQAAVARAAAGDIDGARALVPDPFAVARVGNLSRLAAVCGAIDPSLAEDIARALAEEENPVRTGLTLRFMADLVACIAHPGDHSLAGTVRDEFDLLAASGGSFTGELAIGTRAALAWRGLGRE